MNFHSYNPATGAYVGTGPADRNPMYDAAQHEALAIRADLFHGKAADAERAAALEQEQEYFLPAHATFTAPPQAPSGEYAAWNGTAWELRAIPQPPPAPQAAEPQAQAADPNHVAAPVLTEAEQNLKDSEALVEEYMQAMARGAGYKSLEAAVSYADEPAVAKYQAEGQKFRRWRSLVWEWFYGEGLQEHIRTGALMAAELNTLAPPLNASPQGGAT